MGADHSIFVCRGDRWQCGVRLSPWEAKRAEEKERLDRDRERKALRRASLEAFYRSCVEVHNGYKKIRRLLRASTTEDDLRRSAEDGEPERSIERATYEKFMDQLEDYQLKAESLYRDVEAKKELFEPEQAKIKKNLGMIESYLRRVLRDYEDGCTQRGDSKRVVLKKELAGFIGRRKGDKTKPFTTELADPADLVRASVVELIEKNTPAGSEQ